MRVSSQLGEDTASLPLIASHHSLVSARVVRGAGNCFYLRRLSHPSCQRENLSCRKPAYSLRIIHSFPAPSSPASFPSSPSAWRSRSVTR
ncbi:hypothetical protein E2C01_028521 [Portunus trituberculatus]|uniref:Uncharacterized protein n=1 Tax=Portunus trituberculatus TaxID=210409 RepID=A0A5B7EPB3_PORTR|nr:hypothetical protein [Portunus trituberculatus]